MNGHLKKISENLNYFNVIAQRSLPRRYKHLSEDLAQDAVALAIEKIHLYNPEKGNIRSWLYRLTQNVCFDALRKLDKLETTPLSFHTFHLEAEDSSSFDEHRRKMRNVRKALKHLNQRDRELIVAKFLFSLSGREVSELMGIPEHQINVYIRRAKLRLQKICLAA